MKPGGNCSEILTLNDAIKKCRYLYGDDYLLIRSKKRFAGMLDKALKKVGFTVIVLPENTLFVQSNADPTNVGTFICGALFSGLQARLELTPGIINIQAKVERDGHSPCYIVIL